MEKLYNRDLRPFCPEMSLNKDKLKKEIRKSFITLVICIFVYVASYILNSLFGGYWLVPEMDGRDRLGGFWSLHTAVMWQPRVGHKAMGHLDYLGALYTPLIQFDRKLIHPTIYISDDAGNQKISNLKVSQVHPHWRDEFLTKITAVAARNQSQQAIRCTLQYTGSDHPREITEIRIRKEFAKTLDVSPPNGFSEKPFEDKYDKWLNDIYVRWVGKLPLPKYQDVTLAIPTKQPQTGTGRIVFYYQRTDDASGDYNGICSAELR